MPALKPYIFTITHCLFIIFCVRECFTFHTSQRFNQKLQKSMSCHRTEKQKTIANLKNKMIENEECQWVTKAIHNLSKVLILNIIALNKISSKLKINRFKIPNYA